MTYTCLSRRIAPAKLEGHVGGIDEHVIVLFGATGDLARRKLLPGLFHLARAGLLPDRYRVIGAGRANSAMCRSTCPRPSGWKAGDSSTRQPGHSVT